MLNPWDIEELEKLEKLHERQQRRWEPIPMWLPVNDTSDDLEPSGREIKVRKEVDFTVDFSI